MPEVAPAGTISLISKLTALKPQIEAELTERILPFWMIFTVDEQNGGFFGRVTNTGEPVRQAPKSLILNTRILWSFAAAYRRFGDLEYLKLAERAYHYLIDFFIDQAHGGAYWMLDSQGFPVDDKKKV